MHTEKCAGLVQSPVIADAPLPSQSGSGGSGGGGDGRRCVTLGDEFALVPRRFAAAYFRGARDEIARRLTGGRPRGDDDDDGGGGGGGFLSSAPVGEEHHCLGWPWPPPREGKDRRSGKKRLLLAAEEDDDDDDDGSGGSAAAVAAAARDGRTEAATGERGGGVPWSPEGWLSYSLVAAGARLGPLALRVGLDPARHCDDGGHGHAAAAAAAGGEGAIARPKRRHLCDSVAARRAEWQRQILSLEREHDGAGGGGGAGEMHPAHAHAHTTLAASRALPPPAATRCARERDGQWSLLAPSTAAASTRRRVMVVVRAHRWWHNLAHMLVQLIIPLFDVVERTVGRCGDGGGDGDGGEARWCGARADDDGAAREEATRSAPSSRSGASAGNPQVDVVFARAAFRGASAMRWARSARHAPVWTRVLSDAGELGDLGPLLEVLVRANGTSD